MEVIGYFVGLKYGGNQAIFSFFSVFEFTFYFFVLRQFYFGGKIKRVISITIWCYPLVALTNIFFIQGYKLATGATYGYMLGAILIIIFSSNYYHELLKSSPSIKILRHPPFWICSGLIFFYGTMTPFFGILNYALRFTEKELVVFLVTLSITNYVLYSSFAIAFICWAKYDRFWNPVSKEG